MLRNKDAGIFKFLVLVRLEYSQIAALRQHFLIREIFLRILYADHPDTVLLIIFINFPFVPYNGLFSQFPEAEGYHLRR